MVYNSHALTLSYRYSQAAAPQGSSKPNAATRVSLVALGGLGLDLL